MIEYYTLMHKGGNEEYTDNIFLNFGSSLTVLILNTSTALQQVDDDTEKLRLVENGKIAGSVVNSASDLPFEPLRDFLNETILPSTDHMLIRIKDDMIQVDRKGKIYAKIVKDGDLKLLPNGRFGLENEDRVVCGTGEFFKHLSNPGVLSDALISESCKEWMDNMVCRISEQNMLAEGDLTAVTFIVRGDEGIKIYNGRQE